MSVSALLQIFQPSESQSEKMTAVNTALGQLERVVADKYTLNAGVVISSETSLLTLEYDNTEDMSPREALRFIYMEITGAPSQAFTVRHPALPHLFIVNNTTGQDATFEIPTSGATEAIVEAGASNILYTSATGVIKVLADTRVQKAQIDAQFWGRPDASEVIGRSIISYETVLAVGMPESFGKVTTNPTASFDIDVQRNGTSIGTITVDTGGAFTFATDGGVPRTIFAGNEVTFHAPATVDATIKDIRFAIAGTQTLA